MPSPRSMQRVRTAVRSRILALLRQALDERDVAQAARHAELLEALRAWERRQRRDVFTALDRQAAATSADLVRTRMAGARLFTHPHDTLRDALAQAPSSGLALEFGVAGGTTLAIIAGERPGLRCVGFDSFAGLPEKWRLGFEAGAFAVDEPPSVPGAELVVGLFADTLPGWLRANPGEVAFLHLDADLYSSTKTVLDLLGPRLGVGAVVLFDEYYNYPGWELHEHRAWQEWTAAHDVTFDYVALTMDDEQVAVRLTRGPSPSAA